MKHACLIEHLRSPELTERLSGAAGAGQFDAGEVEKAIGWTLGLRDGCLDALTDAGGSGEDSLFLEYVGFYIDLKGLWAALNTRMNYQMLRSGTCEDRTLVRAAAVSRLLEWIEQTFTENDMETIGVFLSQSLGCKEAA